MKSALGIFANYFAHVFKKAATIGNMDSKLAAARTRNERSYPISTWLARRQRPTCQFQVVKFVNDWRKAAKEVLIVVSSYEN